MVDFEEEKKFGSKGKILPRTSDILAKMSQNIVAYSFSEYSMHFFMSRKKLS